MTSTEAPGILTCKQLELICCESEVPYCCESEAPFNKTFLDNVNDIAADYVSEIIVAGELIHRAALKRALKGLEGFPWGDVRLNLFLMNAYEESDAPVESTKDLAAAERLFRVIRERNLDVGGRGRPAKVARNEMFRRLGQIYVGRFKDQAERKRRRITRKGKRDKYRGHMFIEKLAKLIDPNLTDDDLTNGILAAAKLLSWWESETS